MLDIAKSVFQVHGVDADGAVVIRRRVGRAKVLEFFAELPPCLVGMEACATAHQWARELKKLGHDTRLMPPTYVKAYVKRGKNDAADAAAICEAVTRPSMRFVPIKSVEQQSALMLHRTRDLLIRQRTQLINALRAHLAELGLVAAKGREGLQQLVTAVTESSDERLPSNARFACHAIVAQLHAVQTQINGLDKRITQAHRANADSKRLDAIPGFGVILSTAVVATMTDPKAFKTGREFAAWIGLVPRQNSTGGKERLGSISKQGDRYLRRLLVVVPKPTCRAMPTPGADLFAAPAGVSTSAKQASWEFPATRIRNIDPSGGRVGCAHPADAISTRGEPLVYRDGLPEFLVILARNEAEGLQFPEQSLCLDRFSCSPDRNRSARCGRT